MGIPDNPVHLFKPVIAIPYAKLSYFLQVLYQFFWAQYERKIP